MPIVQMIDKNLEPSRYQALRFALWIGMASITMMFAALTSAYIVRRAAGSWYEFKLPAEFFVSTLFILLSSYLVELAYRAFKVEKYDKFKTFITAGFFSGVLFIAAQIVAWKALFAMGITIDLNVSGSFLYAMSGLHALHVVGGLAALSLSVMMAFSPGLKFSQVRHTKLDLVRQYWHFVDILWIYLLVFLILI